MTYEEFINNIIETRGQWSDDVLNSDRGCERHHIVPACCGGEGDFLDGQRSRFYKDSKHKNCIYLYPSEHFIAHKLLAEENKENRSLVSAFWAMCNKNTSSTEKYVASPEEYERAKSAFSLIISKNEHERAINRTEEEKSILVSKLKDTWDNKAEDAIQSSIQKRKQTCLDVYGCETYNNQKKRLDTIEKKDPELVKASYKKRAETLENKTDVEKELYKKRLSESRKRFWANASEEYRRANSLKRSGGNNSCAVKVMCETTGEIFSCMKEACEKYGLNRNSLRKLLNTHKADKNGYFWVRIE